MSRSKSKRSQSVAVHLKEGPKERILKLLEQWQGRLNWEPFLDAVKEATGHRYTRQALWNHEKIRLLWLSRKNQLKHQTEKEDQQKGSLGVLAALEKRDRLQREVDRLKAEINNLYQMFERWAFNARLAGLDPEILNRPLPPKSLDSTDPVERPKRVSRKGKSHG